MPACATLDGTLWVRRSVVFLPHTTIQAVQCCQTPLSSTWLTVLLGDMRTDNRLTSTATMMVDPTKASTATESTLTTFMIPTPTATTSTDSMIQIYLYFVSPSSPHIPTQVHSLVHPLKAQPSSPSKSHGIPTSSTTLILTSLNLIGEKIKSDLKAGVFCWRVLLGAPQLLDPYLVQPCSLRSPSRHEVSTLSRSMLTCASSDSLSSLSPAPT